MNQDIGGQIIIREVKITNKFKTKTLNLEEVFIAINIYEDLFLPFKSGRIILSDTNELQTFLPVIGGETLDITYQSVNDKKVNVFTFSVYNMVQDLEVTSKSKNVKRIILFFTSEEQLVDSTSALSKHFAAKADATISELLTKYLKSNKKFAFDSTDSPVEFVSNFWTPSKIIKFLSRSVTQSNLSDFVFFEDRNGFNFKSVSNLMKEPPTHVLHFEDSLETQFDMSLIQRFTVSKYFNLMQMAKDGQFGNTVFQFDNEKYKFTKDEEDFDSITAHGTSLGKNVQFHDDFKNNNSIITTYKNSKTISKRDQLLKALDRYHMTIQLTGDSTKTIGQVYDIEIREMVRDSKENNKFMSGKWFVTNINHEITRAGIYTQNIKVVKNAFYNLKENTNVKGKKNI
jgi:hypothetical protein